MDEQNSQAVESQRALLFEFYASVSRDVRIETAANGLVRFESDRSKLLKAAIARGLLSELSAVERNIYPKRDRAAIGQILRRFGIERVSEQQA